MQMKPKDIRPGDRVELESGELVTVTANSRGMILGTRLIEWNTAGGKRDWGHLFHDQQVLVQRPHED